jgi:hypothetical protein
MIDGPLQSVAQQIAWSDPTENTQRTGVKVPRRSDLA